MPKAGLFAGEVTNSAPADGALTTKNKAYHWMEYGDPVPEYPDQSRVIAWWEYEEPTLTFQGLDDEVQATEFKAQNQYTSVTGVRGQAAQVAITGDENMEKTSDAEDTVLTLVDQIWSCAGWYKTPASLTGMEDTYIVSSWLDTVELQGTRKWRFVYNPSANGFIYSIGQGPLPSNFTDLGTGDISLKINTWYHFALTHDPDADEMSLTVTERGLGSASARLVTSVVGGADIGVPSVPIQQIWMGRDRSGAPGTKTNGAIDMLSFWNTGSILSEADVNELFVNELIYSELST